MEGITLRNRAGGNKAPIRNGKGWNKVKQVGRRRNTHDKAPADAGSSSPSNNTAVLS